MSTVSDRLLVTAATGQLGRLVVLKLLEAVPAERIAVAVRDPSKAADLAARGVSVRQADYARAETLSAAFAGVGRLLLISGSEVGGPDGPTPQRDRRGQGGRRGPDRLHEHPPRRHDPAAAAGRRAPETEALLAGSGVASVVLRNGWYTENQTASIPAALAHGAVLGCAGDGRFSSAARADYAAAAAAVLTGDGHAGRTYELAGDASYTLADFAAEIARQSGKPIVYKDLPAAEFEAALKAAGLPPALAGLVATADAAAAQGALFDDGKQLSRLIGRPTTPCRPRSPPPSRAEPASAGHVSKMPDRLSRPVPTRAGPSRRLIHGPADPAAVLARTGRQSLAPSRPAAATRRRKRLPTDFCERDTTNRHVRYAEDSDRPPSDPGLRSTSDAGFAEIGKLFRSRSKYYSATSVSKPRF